ncbi:lipopolysaccharide biosynthesis protein, partial [Methylobacterium trifolii]
GRGSRVEAGRLLAYGWPLALSFGTAALAASLDRLIIGRTVGPEELGAYGAIADFLKQSFVVFGEALTLSMIPIAKREARLGGWPAASAILADAARAIALLAAFGAVFFSAFDDVVIAILLGPDYRAEAQRLAPVLILASILMTLRAHYFGQVIYFARTSRLELAASVAALVTVAGPALLLIPSFGVMGAAIAFAAGQGAACLVFILGARWRAEGAIAMPLPGADILGIVGGALACALLLWAIGLTPWGFAPAGQALRFVLLIAGFVAVAWRYDVVGIARAVRGRLAFRTR